MINSKIDNSLIKDQVILLTGGAQGIGEGIAKQFFNLGAKLIICDINIKKLNNIKN